MIPNPELVKSTLVLMAANDQVIPQVHTESLIQSIPKHLVNTTVFNAGHNDLDLMPEYFDTLRLFLDSKD